MNSLGIYFGPKTITIVEANGKRLINNIRISQSAISSGDLEEKVPAELKTVTLFKDQLEKAKIEATKATVSLSGKDLIIRTFDLPTLPREELNNAINFEVRKYIPFKVEDLISDFQVKKIDRYKRKSLVLFVGIKKETLDSYLSMLSQLDLKIDSIEYSGFSVLRLLKLANVRDKGVVGMLNIDLMEEDEVNFMVLEDGFPLFSRDITLLSASPQVTKTEEPSFSIALEKLKKEIRISLDYYYRKFPTKKINKTFFITGQDYRTDLEAFLKEIGLDIQFIDVNKYIDKPVPFSLSFIKAYSNALSKIIKTKPAIDLLSAKTRATKEPVAQLQATSLLAGLKVDFKVLFLGLVICIAPFLFGIYFRTPLEKELKDIIGMRPLVSAIKTGANYEEISAMDSQSRSKIQAIDSLFKKQVYLTELLDAVRRVIPEDAWLLNLFFRKVENRIEFTLQGNAYLADSAKELDLVHKFLLNLKENSTFTKYFKQMDIVSVGQAQGVKPNETMTHFEILCQSPY